MGLAQLGLGVGQMIGGSGVDTQKAYNQAYSNAMGQLQAQQQNQQIQAAYTAKIDYVKNQIENNYTAAQASWVAEQMRTNEVYDRAAYQSQALQKMLKEAMGTAAAREVYGKSARRGALVANLGAYGRTRAQQVAQLMSETTQAQMRMKQTEQKLQAANKMATAELAVIPQMQFAPQMNQQFGQSALNTALQIGQTAMGAFQTGWNMTPSQKSFFGIQKA